VAVCGHERKGLAGAVYIWQHEAQLGGEGGSRAVSPDSTMHSAGSPL
jgi:hypothetical protein